MDPKERSIERVRAAQNLLETVQAGVPPSSEQLAYVIEQGKRDLGTSAALSAQRGTLTTEGTTVVADAQKVLSDVQQLIITKNLGERVQKITAAAGELQPETWPDLPGRLRTKAQDVAGLPREDLRALLINSRILAEELVRSGRFRSLVTDLLNLIMSTLHQSRLFTEHPDIAALASHTEQVVSKNLPIAGIQPVSTAPMQSTTTSSSVEERVAFQPQQTPNTKVMFSPSEVLATNIAPTSPYKEVNVPQSQFRHDVPISYSGTSTVTNVPVVQNTAPIAEHQITAENIDWNANLWSPVSRDEISDRITEILTELSARKAWNDAVRAILNISHYLYYEAIGAYGEIKGVSRELRTNDEVRQLLNESKELIEEFVGYNTFDPFVTDLRRLVGTISHDAESRAYFWDLRALLLQGLDNPVLFQDALFKARFRDTLHRGKLLSDKYLWHGATNAVIDRAKSMIENVRSDPLMKQLYRDTRKLAMDVATDESGRFALKPELFEQIRSLIGPLLIEQIRNIPVPRIEDIVESKFGKFAFVVDGIVLSGVDLMPNYIKLRMDNDIDFSLNEFNTSIAKRKTNFHIVVSRIQVRLRDVRFAYRRLSVPRVQDQGFIDIDMDNEGMELKLSIRVNSWNRYPMFSSKSISCNIDRLAIRMHDTKHDRVYNTFTRFFGGVIKKTIERRIVTQIQMAFDRINATLNDLVPYTPSGYESRSATTASMLPNAYQSPYPTAATAGATTTATTAMPMPTTTTEEHETYGYEEGEYVEGATGKKPGIFQRIKGKMAEKREARRAKKEAAEVSKISGPI